MIRLSMMMALLATTATSASPVGAQLVADAANGWITDAAVTPDNNPVVLHFRRTLDLKRKPGRFPVQITADNRFILYVNGVRVVSGPSTGDVSHWRQATVDLAPYLRGGRNVLAAVVWNGVKPLKLPPNATSQQKHNAEGAALFTQTAPNFQQSVATGFRIIGSGEAAPLSSDRPGWRVKRDAGHSFENGWRQVVKSGFYYVAGSPETIDAAQSDWGWTSPEEKGAGWHDAVPAPTAAQRTLTTDKLPPQSYQLVPFGRVVRSDVADAKSFPSRPIVIPPNSTIKLLIQRDAMVSAYPQLDVSGGAGAKVSVTWSEALYDDKLKKADRNLISDRNIFGIHDTFLADGQARTFETLWWRTWRYAEIAVETKDQPLTLSAARAFETGYPFTQVGAFAANDPTLKSIFDVGWRTARIDAHETYMDTAYWEQLQYIGDTRLQALISYAVAGDPRLPEQAIDAFASTNVENGLMDGAYPQRVPNVIAPFALMWVGMLDDWRMQQSDVGPLRRHAGRMRTVLDWFQPWQKPSGLLGKNPQWNFVDWVGQPATDRTRFPSYGKDGESCLMSVLWLGALQQGARVETAIGESAQATQYDQLAGRVKQAIRDRCWVASRGLFADNPDGVVFSQHTNALAVLYDVVPQAEAPAILGRIVAPGKGIDAPEGMFTTSYYFAWYLAQAYLHAGKGDQYLALLDTWRDLLKLNYTTWPEERGNTRSDSHAWSAHPTADLLGIIAGIRPGAPGYTSVLVAPALGSLTKVAATAATPAGPVKVRYQVFHGHLSAEITRPASLPGVFEWAGRRYPLTRATTRLRLPLR